MRLLITIPHFSAAAGGAEAYARLVAAGLAARGHEVHVAALDGDRLDGVALHLVKRLDEHLARSGLPRTDLTLDWGLHVPADVHRLGGGTHREFLEYNLLGYAPAHRAFKRLTYFFSAASRLAVRRERALLARPGTHYLAVSRFVAGQLMHAAPWIPETNLRVLHNGVDIGRFNPRIACECRLQRRRELGLRPEHVAFLFVAHNTRLKNLALLERVFARIQAELPSARLVVAGKRPPARHADWLLWAGKTERPERLYAAGDVLLHPTYYDACANVVLEALACGLPAVSSDLNGSAEIIADDRHGYVLPVTGDPKTVERRWSAAVRGLAADAALRMRLGQAAARLAADHSVERYLDALEEFLGEVLAARGRSSVNSAASAATVAG